MKLTTCFLPVLLLFVIHIINSQTGYPLEEYLSQTKINELTVSPDGQNVAVVISKDNFEENKTQSKLVYYNITDEGEVLKKLELHQNADDFSNLQWTKDSQHLFYFASDSLGKSIFRIPVDSPQNVVMAVENREDVSNISFFQVSDNENILAIQPYFPEPQKENEEILKYPEPVIDQHTTFRAIRWKKNEVDSLFTIPHSMYSYSLSPNQKLIAFTEYPKYTYLTEEVYKNSHSYWFNLEQPLKIKQLTNDRAGEYMGWWDDDSVLVYSFENTDIPRFNFSFNQLKIKDLNEESLTLLDPSFDEDIRDFIPYKKNQILIQANASTSSHFYTYTKEKIEKITDQKMNVSNFAGNAKGIIVFSMTTKSEFEEVYFAKDLDGLKNPIRISSFNQNLSEYPKPETETISWTNSRGETIEGVLLWPPGQKGNKNLPFVVDIHGGPWSSRNEVISLNSLQYYYYGSLLASKGFLVLQPNYSGGTGRGQKFADAINMYPRTRPTDDILTGLAYLKSKNQIDTSKMVVMGASYGGLLTNSIIGETDMFQVALPSCGVWNEILSYGTSDNNTSRKILFGGKDITEAYETYRKESAASNATSVTTPTLITHGGKDKRVPTANSYAMYHTLKDLGVPVKLLVFKNEGHLYSQPKNKLAKVKAEFDFINTYIPGVLGQE